MPEKYKDIEDYGIIGNLETCSLVGRDGSIDWLCFPFLESGSCFAAILDAENGGHFYIRPCSEYESTQVYVKHTNILKTTFSTALGEVVVTDFMEVKGRRKDVHFRSVFRKLECTKGEVEIEVGFKPRFNYARMETNLETLKEGILAKGGEEKLFLKSPRELNIEAEEASSKFPIKKGEVLWFTLQHGNQKFLSDKDCEALLEKVKKHWLGWSNRSAHSKVGLNESWNELVVRSGLVLQMLVNPETGSIAAAATASLPEKVGGSRNWDYRYAWIRDASFTVQALYHIDHMKEAKNFRGWIWNIIGKYKDPSQIRIMYGLHSEADIQEQILDNLSGYKGSSPVRIGNGAVNQKQLDIYGELLNMVYETDRYGEEVPKKRWPEIRTIVDYVCDTWKKPDSGIWEVRGNERHFVYSKLMCWVAIDRGIKIAEMRKYKASLDKWKKERSALKEALEEKGFNKKLGSFVQSFGSDTLDATSLLIPVMGFLPARDRRVQGTIEATMKHLLVKDCLVYRYKSEDGLPGQEGNFILCSFWLVKALALSGRIEEAEDIFLKILNHISPLGLFAEEIDPETDKQIGNFPQAFSHIGLINSALYIGMAKGKEHKGPAPMGING